MFRRPRYLRARHLLAWRETTPFRIRHIASNDLLADSTTILLATMTSVDSLSETFFPPYDFAFNQDFNIAHSAQHGPGQADDIVYNTVPSGNTLFYEFTAELDSDMEQASPDVTASSHSSPARSESKLTKDRGDQDTEPSSQQPTIHGGKEIEAEELDSAQEHLGSGETNVASPRSTDTFSEVVPRNTTDKQESGAGGKSAQCSSIDPGDVTAPKVSGPATSLESANYTQQNGHALHTPSESCQPLPEKDLAGIIAENPSITAEKGTSKTPQSESDPGVNRSDTTSSPGDDSLVVECSSGATAVQTSTIEQESDSLGLDHDKLDTTSSPGNESPAAEWPEAPTTVQTLAIEQQTQDSLDWAIFASGFHIDKLLSVTSGAVRQYKIEATITSDKCMDLLPGGKRTREQPESKAIILLDDEIETPKLRAMKGKIGNSRPRKRSNPEREKIISDDETEMPRLRTKKRKVRNSQQWQKSYPERENMPQKDYNVKAYPAYKKVGRLRPI
jgi:hypothetical protein